MTDAEKKQAWYIANAQGYCLEFRITTERVSTNNDYTNYKNTVAEYPGWKGAAEWMVDNGFTFSSGIFSKENDTSLHHAINQRLAGYLAANDTGYKEAQLVLGYSVLGTNYEYGRPGQRSGQVEDYAIVCEGYPDDQHSVWDDDDRYEVNAPILLVRPL